MTKKVRITLAIKRSNNRKWHLKGEKKHDYGLNEHTFCGLGVGSGFDHIALTLDENQVCATCLRRYVAYCDKYSYPSPYEIDQLTTYASDKVLPHA